ncbi:MAG TPA: tetratricopeptide repeat protein, partial [Acidovorax sp.]|nr:tetratricopeptide repeat protein [Acidovorax sp.]
PELPEPYNNLAVIYASQNQLDKARTALEMAVRNNPAYAAAHENLGDIYARQAYQSYAKAQKLEANNAAVKSKLALVRQLLQPVAARPAKPATARP